MRELINNKPMHLVLVSVLELLVEKCDCSSAMIGTVVQTPLQGSVYRIHGLVGFDKSSQLYKDYLREGYIETLAHFIPQEDQLFVVKNHMEPLKTAPDGHPVIKHTVYFSLQNKGFLVFGRTTNRFTDDEITAIKGYCTLTEIFYTVCQEKTRYVMNQETFLHKVSHELRAPLNALASLNRNNFGEMEAQLIETCCSQMLDIVNNLIDYIAISGNKLTFKDQLFPVRERLKLVCRYARNDISDDVTLNLYIDDTVPETLVIDPQRLEQLVMHVLSNSVRYTKRGFINVTVRYHAKKLTITVEDTGSGMTKKEQEDAFDTMCQSTKKGLGMGLPLAKHIALHYNGDIQVTSEVDKGTCVTITLTVDDLVRNYALIDDELPDQVIDVITSTMNGINIHCVLSDSVLKQYGKRNYLYVFTKQPVEVKCKNVVITQETITLNDLKQKLDCVNILLVGASLNEAQFERCCPKDTLVACTKVSSSLLAASKLKHGFQAAFIEWGTDHNALVNELKSLFPNITIIFAIPGKKEVKNAIYTKKINAHGYVLVPITDTALTIALNNVVSAVK